MVSSIINDSKSGRRKFKYMFKDIMKMTEKDFESIKHVDENGVEFWYARELMKMLEYSNGETLKM